MPSSHANSSDDRNQNEKQNKNLSTEIISSEKYRELYRCGHHSVIALHVAGMDLGFEVRHDALLDINDIWVVWTLDEAIQLIADLQSIDRRDYI